MGWKNGLGKVRQMGEQEKMGWKNGLQHMSKKNNNGGGDLMRKLKRDEIEQIKKQNVHLEETIETLRKDIVKEAIASDKKQDLSHATKTLVEKEKTYKEIRGIQEKLEDELSRL